MELVATPELRESYERLDYRAAERVGRALHRLVADPASAWARQNRVVGAQGSAWLIMVRCATCD